MITGCLAGCGNSKTASSGGSASSGSDAAGTEAAADANDTTAAENSGESAKARRSFCWSLMREPVDIHIVLQYRESEDPNTPFRLYAWRHQLR